MVHITTPFGRRTLSLGMVAAQVAARDIEGKAAHKWKTFRAITGSREVLGVTDRDLVVLNAMLSCIRDAAELASALSLLRSIAGNLQRLYVAHAASGISDVEILQAKREVQEISSDLRSILKRSEDAP